MVRLIRYGFILSFMVALLGVVIVILSLTLWSRNEQSDQVFVQVPLLFNYYDWFDAGVADINSDGFLDLFSSHHDARQNLLIGKGNGEFHDALSEMKFDQDPVFPGLEDSDEEIKILQPGLYLYYHSGRLKLRLVDANSTAEVVKAEFSLSSDVKIVKNQGFDIDINRKQLTPVVTHSQVYFGASKSAKAELAIPYKAVPMSVKIDGSVALRNVFIGQKKTNPQQHRFILHQRDRHGIAWSDINHDGLLDAFIVRGGLNGLINQFPDRIENEFLRSNANLQYVNVTKELGLNQIACPARQVMWVDYDADGDLDLYVVCGRQTGGFWEFVPQPLRRMTASDSAYPNRLYEQNADGGFHEVAASIKLDFKEGGYAVWFDADQDGAMDLLWASEQGLFLYRNHSAEQKELAPGELFERTEISPATGLQVRRFALSDYDADGDLDVFAISAYGSRILRNNNGVLESVDPSSLGLPTAMKTGSWLDYDNDGLTDFYAWPQGMYRQNADGRFVETGILAFQSPWAILMDARALWFDYDNDGDLDVLILHRYYPHIMQKALPSVFPFSGALFENRSVREQHWLVVDLHGKAGNVQALGAKVQVHTDTRQQFQWVGQSEASHYSQGHYRVYFGLGDDDSPVKLYLRWPDGYWQEQTVAVDQRLTLRDERDETADGAAYRTVDGQGILPDAP